LIGVKENELSRLVSRECLIEPDIASQSRAVVEVTVTCRAAPRAPARRAPLPESDALVCSYCGAVSAFDSGVSTAGWAEALSGGFVVHRHRLLLFGRCASCRAAAREVVS
jgi:Fur family ferric uptake transcriptional regulator